MTPRKPPLLGYDHTDDPHDQALRRELRLAGLGESYVAVVIDEQGLQWKRTLTAADWRAVTQAVRERIQPAIKERAAEQKQRLAKLKQGKAKLAKRSRKV